MWVCFDEELRSAFARGVCSQCFLEDGLLQRSARAILMFMELCGRTIEGLLIDIDGVLYVGNRAVDGAALAVESLEVPHLYLTNTTTRSVARLADKLRELGFPVEEGQILSAPMAALEYLKSVGSPEARLVMRQEVIADFGDYPQSLEDAEAVVVGDIGDAWSYSLQNELFRLLMKGADLIALHKNKFWQTPEGLNLDIGAFIEGLSYASGRPTTVVGKPSSAFFEAALRRLGIAAEHAAMIGDDIDSDIAGAQAVGILGVLVKTGKYRESYVNQSDVKPDWVIDSIATLHGT